MDLTTVSWILCLTLVTAICVMVVGLVALVMKVVELYQQIRGRNARN